MSGKKHFILMKGRKDTSQVFANNHPRGAALKAASRGETDIHLRERGTNRVHVFSGWREQVAKPKGGPPWLPAKVWKANVKKQRVDLLAMKSSKAKNIKRKKEDKPDYADDFNKTASAPTKLDTSTNRLDTVLEKMSRQELVDMIHRLTGEGD